MKRKCSLVINIYSNQDEWVWQIIPRNRNNKVIVQISHCVSPQIIRNLIRNDKKISDLLQLKKLGKHLLF